jgi:hypothetical protein
MHRQLTLVFSSIALGAALSLPAMAQEYSNGGNGKKGRNDATLTPVEAFGVHPPGPDPADSHRRFFCWWRKTYVPYYAPVAPVATSVRWKPWCYFPLMPYYTPYYNGYCPHRLCNPQPQPYGYDGGWGKGPMPDHPFPANPEEAPLRYGGYTSVIQDDTIFWKMGGNGLVPYGTPRPSSGGSPDLVDAIQVSRGKGDGCIPPLGAVPAAVPVPASPAEKPDE